MATEHPGSGIDEQRLQEILHAYLQAIDAGQAPDQEEIVRQHPDLADELRAFFADQKKLDLLAKSMRAGSLTEGLSSREILAPAFGTKVRYFGDYEVLEEIARGGMGIVYKARQVSLQRLVALKMILAGELASDAQVQRFRKEAEAAAQLDHPHIVPIYEVGEHGGHQYFSMKLVEGASLARKIKELEHQYPASAQLMATVARALQYAHQRGIIHRDLKPSNILIDAQGQAHVSDFGLAKQLDSIEAPTRTGVILGTPCYMAPEQAAGQVRQIGIAADVYSLGSILYELLTGRPPFRAETPMEVLTQVMNDEPVAPRLLEPKVPKDLETICLKCLEKAPRKRYLTAQALAEDLERWFAGEPIVARPAGWPERLAKWAKRRPAVAGLMLTLLVSLAGLLGLAAWSYARISQALDDVEAQRVAAVAAGEREALQRREAEKARDAAVAETYRALLSETRALRLAHPPGWRAEALHKLRRLQQLDTPRDLAELRSEALACVSEFDLFAAAPLRGGNVWSVDFSPDGKQLAAASYDGSVRLWDVAKASELRQFQDPELDPSQLHQSKAPLPAVRFRPGADWLAFTTWGRGIAFEEWRARQAPLPALKRKGPARYLAFDGSGRLLAVSWGDGTVGIYDADTGATVKEIDTKVGRYFHLPVALSPDGKRVAVMGPDHTVQLYTVAEAQPPVSLGKHRDVVRALCFSRAGDRLASASADHTVKLWNPAQPGGDPLTLVGHTARVNCAAFHPNGSLLATGGDDRTLRLWETSTGAMLRVLPCGSNTLANALSIAFSPDGNRLAAADSLTVYQLTSRQGRQALAGHSYGVAGSVFHPNKRLLASAAWDRQLIIWDLETGRPLRRGRGERNNPMQAIAAAPDGSVIATGLGSYTNASGTDFAIDLWDWETGALLRQLKGPQATVTALAFHPSSKLLAAGTADGTWLVWDLATDAVVQRKKLASGAVRDLAFIGKGEQLLVAGCVGRLELYDLSESKTVRAVDLPGGLNSVALTRDELHLAVGARDGTLRILAFPTLEEKAKLTDPSGSIGALVFSPDGRLLASSADRKVTVWDVRSQRRLFTLPQHSPVHHLAFDPEGQRLAICGAAEVIIVWNFALIRPELRTIGLDWEPPLP
jgi:WD40 repeat protein/tRNA A-37 threonylcarbamoyl transferase component Bud32